jgi:glycosyltransferase involved in cell wall biosynthesis
MKILIVNTYHYLRGGDCQHAFGLGKLLQQNGHEIHYFAMKGNKNLTCGDDGYFVKEIDYRKALNNRNPFNAFRVILHSIYSIEARRNIARLLDKVKPDIVHLQSIRHHLTKSILPELDKRNIPVVWTLHDFKEICPNTSFYNGRTICESCKGKKYANILWNRCKKGSLAASLVTYLEAKINDYLNYEKCVDLYISPSKFLKNKFIEYGYCPQKIIYLPNFMELDDFVPQYNYEDYLLFIGRLEKGKGLTTMVKGFAGAKNIGNLLGLKIAGAGSIEGELKDLFDRMEVSNIEILGFKQGSELKDLTQKAKAVIIPSECYENYPFSGLEAMAYGKPIIASRIGGIPEQVEDGVTGFLFEPFDEDQLSAKINLLNSLTKEEIKEMGRRARQKVERNNDKNIYFSSILNIYQRLLQDKKYRPARPYRREVAKDA